MPTTEASRQALLLHREAPDSGACMLTYNLRGKLLRKRHAAFVEGRRAGAARCPHNSAQSSLPTRPAPRCLGLHQGPAHLLLHSSTLLLLLRPLPRLELGDVAAQPCNLELLCPWVLPSVANCSRESNLDTLLAPPFSFSASSAQVGTLFAASQPCGENLAGRGCDLPSRQQGSKGTHCPLRAAPAASAGPAEPPRCRCGTPGTAWPSLGHRQLLLLAAGRHR